MASIWCGSGEYLGATGASAQLRRLKLVLLPGLPLFQLNHLKTSTTKKENKISIYSPALNEATKTFKNRHTSGDFDHIDQ